jgi:microcystin-dependent protein
MSAPFLGEIRAFPFNFAPNGWAFCSGQILSIAQNTALFSLLGTNYGGNGTSNFALPDLRGRLAVSSGQGPGLSDYTLGSQSGVETVTMLSSEMAAHNHAANCTNVMANQPGPSGNVWAADGAGITSEYGPPVGGPPHMAAQAIGATGGNQPHTNLMPYLALNYCIAMQGIFPTRN